MKWKILVVLQIIFLAHSLTHLQRGGGGSSFSSFSSGGSSYGSGSYYGGSYNSYGYGGYSTYGSRGYGGNGVAGGIVGAIMLGIVGALCCCYCCRSRMQGGGTVANKGLALENFRRKYYSR